MNSRRHIWYIQDVVCLAQATKEHSVQQQHAPIDVVLDALRRAQFDLIDVVRRAQGIALGALGLDPDECPYRIIRSGPCWRLRDYADAGHDPSPALLIVAAPIKRPYIWDLAPSASAIRCCLRQRLHVYLLEWMPASHHTENSGFDGCVSAISECVAKVSAETPGTKPFLAGHSLGGTLAAIFGASAPDTLQGLVLLSAPLCFRPGESQFRDALVSLVPSTISEGDLFPGSLLSYMSALASPETFVWSRLQDAMLSATDSQAIDIHARVERWVLDEVPLSGRLVREIIEWLYRENRLCRGVLRIRDTVVGPMQLSVPTLAVVNTNDAVAPLCSLKAFTEAMPTGDVCIIEYPGEVGVSLQHLGILIGREAQAQLWPRLVFWINAHMKPASTLLGAWHGGRKSRSGARRSSFQAQ
jgi:polyhydroxyalkanoate synthase subunit PhaC